MEPERRLERIGGQALIKNGIFWLVTIAAALIAASAGAATLEDVKRNGIVHCGVSQDLPGFSSADKNGYWVGLDVDICRALAATILGSAANAKFAAMSTVERFTALPSGKAFGRISGLKGNFSDEALPRTSRTAGIYWSRKSALKMLEVVAVFDELEKRGIFRLDYMAVVLNSGNAQAISGTLTPTGNWGAYNPK